MDPVAKFGTGSLLCGEVGCRVIRKVASSLQVALQELGKHTGMTQSMLHTIRRICFKRMLSLAFNMSRKDEQGLHALQILIVYQQLLAMQT